MYMYDFLNAKPYKNFIYKTVYYCMCPTYNLKYIFLSQSKLLVRYIFIVKMLFIIFSLVKLFWCQIRPCKPQRKMLQLGLRMFFKQRTISLQ